MSSNEENKQPKVELNVIPGEAFIRIAFNESTSATEFTCGLFPSDRAEDVDFDEEEDFDPDTMLSLCTAGLAYFLQYDSETLMKAGMKYISEGNEVFDIIIDTKDTEFYQGLTEEQMQLMSMAAQGEA